MNSLIRKSATSFGTLVVAVFFLIIMTIISISGVTHATANNGSDRGRLITIHDRGNEKIIVSRAATIGDVLKEANIILDSKDVVEPSVNEKLVASNYQVNIYRARPVIIVDGNIRQKAMTSYRTADQIASSVGITLFPEDKTMIDRVDNLTEGVGLQLTITRATSFQFTLYGKVTTARTQGKTVREMLEEKGLKLSSDDRVSPSLGTSIIDNLAVRVWREGKQTISVDESVDFDIDKTEDANRDVGYLNITSPGVKGVRSVTYEIIVQDGQEVSRSEIASVIVKPAIIQTEVVGIKGQYTTPSENETITWDFLISNGFSRLQTAGIMGNLMQEHGFRTSDTSGGYGLVQWTGGRRAELLSMPYPDNIYTQLNFLMHELNTNYSSVKNAIMSSITLEEAENIFQNKYERCGICMEFKRMTYARNILASH